MEANKIPWEMIIAHFKQEISDDQRQQLDAWLSEDTHRKLFDELHALWEKIQAKSADYTPDAAYYWKELSARMHTTSSEGKVEARKVGESIVVKRKLIPMKALYRYAAVVCVVLASAVWLSYYIGATFNQSELTAQTFQNLSGKSKVRLPDGTNVWLHTNTTLSYGGEFSEDSRTVSLSGEAYFEVTPDKNRPFSVQANGMSVVVHGTKFNVDAPLGGDESTVSLVEGSVSLETPTDNQFLKPGETAVYNRKNEQLRIGKGDVQFDRLWANDQLLVSNKTLGDVCRQLSKWYGVTIHVNPALANRYRYTFTLRNEPLEEVLRLMSRINPIAYSFDEENVLKILTIN